MSNTVPASETAGGTGKMADRKTFPCDACGAQLTFSIGAQRLKCDHCGAEKELVFAPDAQVAEQDLNAALARQGTRRKAAHKDASAEQEVRCGSCGSTVVFKDTLTSTECGYCGGPIQRKDAHAAEDRLPVDGVCPFGVEKADAQQRLKQWVSGLWFAPSAFTQAGVNEKFQGVYMPYFTFDAMTYSRYQGERGDAYFVTEKVGDQERQVRKIRWSFVTGALQRFFDDVCVPALRSLPAPLLRGLEPWPLERLVPFTDQALAGKQAHTYELDLAECFASARDRMESDIRGDVQRDIGGDEQRIQGIDTHFSALTYKHVLLPIWILAYRYQAKSYRVVVNALTGEVSGERPWSAGKIALAVLAGMVLAYVVFGALGGGGHPPR